MTATIQDILATIRTRTAPGGQPAPAPRPAAAGCADDCPLCGGGGLVRYDVPPEHEHYGRILPCPNLPRQSRHVKTPSGLYLDDVDRLSWDSILPERVTATVNGQTIPTHARAVAEMVRTYLARPGLVYLCGTYGIGKTLILQVAVAERARAVQPAQYTILADILEDIKAGFDRTNPREDSRARVERWRYHPFLAIDEMDKAVDTDWVRTTLFRLLDTRYELATHESAVTLIASNERPESLEPALASRIRDGRCLVVEFDGADMRPRMDRQGGYDVR